MLLGQDLQARNFSIPVASKNSEKPLAIPQAFHQLKKYITSIKLIACSIETNYLPAPGIVTLLEYHTTTR
jgi:hypothetical protein